MASAGHAPPLVLDPEKDLAELAQVLALPAPPQRIEGFDISNISGTFKVASMVSYLASAEASFVTGQVISVNGGSTML